MNLLEQAAAEGRAWVTRRENRPPEWTHILNDGSIIYGLDGWYMVVLSTGRAYGGSMETNHDLILAPKKATIWYVAHNGRIVWFDDDEERAKRYATNCSSESSLRSVEVDV